MGGRARLMRAGALVGVGWFLALAPPAGADVISPAGACSGSGTWQGGGFSEASADHVPSDVIEIPQADTVVWEGSVGGASPTDTVPRRAISGEVELDLPFGSVTLDDWGGTSERAANTGDHDYDLPDVVIGIELPLHGAHREDGSEVCSGSVNVVVVGGTFDNPLSYAGLVGLILSAIALVVAGRIKGLKTHSVFGGFAGLFFGLFLAISLLVFGALPLDSIILLILPLAFLVIGLVWGKLAPLGGGSAGAGGAPAAI